MLYDKKGVVIIAVLWVCALIMWMALQISVEARVRGEEDAVRQRRSQAIYLAVGGINEALAHMRPSPVLDKTGGGASAEWLPDGYAQEVVYGTGHAIVWIENENAKVNVNRADPSQLQVTLENAGIKEDGAVVLADMIADFISPGNTPRLHGAKHDQYKAMGLPSYLPFNADLTAVEQLLLVPGVTSNLFYGFNLNGNGTNGGAGHPFAPVLPGKNSLFELFTVYGNSNMLSLGTAGNGNSGALTPSPPANSGNEIVMRPPGGQGDATGANPPQWVPGQIYRIGSCGAASTGPPSVLIYMIVQYIPGSGSGYHVIYRKIL